MSGLLSIDPRTGKPYVFSANGSGGENVWTKNGTNLSGADPATGLGGYNGTDGGAANISDITRFGFNQPDWLKSIGAPGGGADLYNGNQMPNGSGENFAGLDSTGQLEKFMQSKGLTLAERGGESNGQNRVFQAFDAQGSPVGQQFKVKDNEDAFQAVVLALGAGAGALAAGGAGVGAGVGAEGGTGVSAVLPGEIGGATEAGYGGGGLLADGGADIAADAPGLSGGGEDSLANVGSDAHFYQPGGPQLGGINAADGTGIATSNAFNAGNGLNPTASDGWLDKLKAGDVTGAIKEGGSGALDWIMAHPGTALQLGSIAAGGLAGGLGSGGSGTGSGANYVPKPPPVGNWKPQVQPNFQPVQQQTGLLAAPQGQANSGLWQYLNGGGTPQTTTQPQGLLGHQMTTQPVQPMPSRVDGVPQGLANFGGTPVAPGTWNPADHVNDPISMQPVGLLDPTRKTIQPVNRPWG